MVGCCAWRLCFVIGRHGGEFEPADHSCTQGPGIRRLFFLLVPVLCCSAGRFPLSYVQGVYMFVGVG